MSLTGAETAEITPARQEIGLAGAKVTLFAPVRELLFPLGGGEHGVYFFGPQFQYL